MQIEYEATFTNINNSNIRERLQSINAVCIKPEFIQKRAVFHLPHGNELNHYALKVHRLLHGLKSAMVTQE